MTQKGGRKPRLDLTKQRYGKLVVQSFAGLNKHSQSLWTCQCDCGSPVKVISANALRRKHQPVQSCGCLKKTAWLSRPSKNIKGGTFRCTGCKRRLKLAEMVPPRTYHCRPCHRGHRREMYAASPEKHREAQRQYREANKEAIKARTNQWREDNLERVLFGTAKRRAKRKGLDFEIAVEDVVIPQTCPVLGLVFDRSRGDRAGKRGFPAPASPTLDRIDNTKGYTPDNVAVISWRANSLKKDATADELERITAWLRAQENNSCRSHPKT